MPNNKSATLWSVNIISFILFLILTLTGLINWLLIPGGYRGEGGFMVSFRHFLRGIHEWTALLFIIAVFIHLVLHWSYIKLNLKKHGFGSLLGLNK
jgi:Domain of unknown function (DUF4405)